MVIAVRPQRRSFWSTLDHDCLGHRKPWEEAESQHICREQPGKRVESEFQAEEIAHHKGKEVRKAGFTLGTSRWFQMVGTNYIWASQFPQLWMGIIMVPTSQGCCQDKTGKSRKTLKWCPVQSPQRIFSTLSNIEQCAHRCHYLRVTQDLHNIVGLLCHWKGFLIHSVSLNLFDPLDGWTFLLYSW